MFDDFFNHTCNIYHLEDETVNAGYGIQAADARVPEDGPAIEGVKCHFYIRQNSQVIVQHEPYSSIDGDVKLALPHGTDIRENDIVEDCGTGRRYRADIPKTIHNNHHIVVMLKRQEGVTSAI